jgi:hypothetical protein
MDPSEYAAGSGTVALSEALKNSGTYDPWVPQPVGEVKDDLETVQEKKFKVCIFFPVSFPQVKSHLIYFTLVSHLFQLNRGT